MTTQRQRYIFPAILSALVAGLGQLTKGEPKKSLRIMLWFYMGFPIIMYITFLLNSYVFLLLFAGYVILYPVFWAANIADAYSSQIRTRKTK